MVKNRLVFIFLSIIILFGVLGVGSALEERENTIIAAANRIVALQDDDGLSSLAGSNPVGAQDGSWDWDVTDKTGSTGITYYNIAGVTAEVLLDAYELTDNEDYLDAAELAGDYIISIPISISQRQNAFSIVFLYRLAEVSGNSDYSDKADAILNHILYEENYWSTHNGNYCGTTAGDNINGCTAEELTNAIIDYRKYTPSNPTGYTLENPTGIIIWDLHKFVEAAELADETSFASDMANIIKDYLDQENFDEETSSYELALSSGIRALNWQDIDYSFYLTDLLDEQYFDGHFENPEFPDEHIQPTAYALMALREVGEFEAAQSASEFLIEEFGYSDLDGWLEDEIEYSEVTSEAAQALAKLEMIYPEISDVYIEPLFPNLFSTLVKIFATITDESGIDYTTIHYQIGDDEIKDMIFEGPFVGGVAGIFNGEPKDGVLVQYHIETINNLGNEKWYPSEVTWESFTYDGSAPTTTLTISDPKFGEPPYVTFDTILTLTCNDTISSCDKTYFKETSETEWNEYTEPLSAPLGTPDGSYIIYYYSLDNAGNEEVEKTQEIILDNTNPEVTLNELNEFYSSVPVNLEFTYSDSGSGINEYKVYKKRLGVDSDFAIISGISCNTIDDTTTCEFMDGLKDGKFEFKVEVIDNVGNSQDSNIVSATLDRAGPDAVNLDSPDDSSYLNEQPLLSWFEGEDNDDNLNPAYGEYGVSGIEEYELELDGEEPITLTELSYQTLELNEGSHSWRVRANDNAGNTGIWSETRTFVIDTTLPEISDMAVNPYYEGSIYVAGTVTASATVTDDNGINSVTFSLGDEECDATNTVDDAWACDIDTISLGDGEYNLIVTAVDVAENENVDDSLIVTVDNTVPSTIITSPEEHSLFASYFDVEIEYSDDGSGLYECQYRVFSNGIPTRDWTLRDCNADITITVGEGMDCNVEDEDVCKVEVRATDNLGNENIVVERTFSIDWTNPPQILSSGPSGTIQNKDTLLYVETNKPATCRYDTEYKSDYDAMSEENEMENTLNGLLHTLPLEDLTDKTYNYYVICKDTVNNEMSYPASISFDVDTRETFAVTIPETKGDYLRIGWNQFFLPSFVLEDTSLTAPYLVEDVLASIGGSYDIIYHYDGTIWRSYEPGRPVNDLIDLTEFNGGVFPYFIDMNVSGERIEISY